MPKSSDEQKLAADGDREPSSPADGDREPLSPTDSDLSQGFAISRAESFMHRKHPAHPVAGFFTWSTMLFIWFQVFGIWCLPVAIYFVYLVLLVPRWLWQKPLREVRKQEEVSAFVYIYGALFTVPIMCFWCTFLAPVAIRIAFLSYVGWFLLLDKDAPKTGVRKFDVLRQHRQWYNFARYFPISLSRTVELDPSKNYIFGYHPHGIISTGALCNFGTEATGFSELFPGIDLRLLTLKSNFVVPFLREYLMGLGINDVSKKSCINNLRRGPGASIMIVIGGAAEALEARPNSYDLTVSTRRKGFVKIALKEGASMVPVFSFGEVDVFDQWSNPEGSKLRRFQKWMTSLIGVSPPIVVGRALKGGLLGRLGFKWGFMPLRMPVHSVVGAPIHCPKLAPDAGEEAWGEAIDKYHALYVEGLRRVYCEHKEEFKDRRREFVAQQEPEMQEVLSLGKDKSFRLKGL